ncbi:DNRLRE domain-containing protein, partial [Patescibacteria group bacterium]|nr:DNRLRE domain-containing protein [Patescibacteria group bacterium]
MEKTNIKVAGILLSVLALALCCGPNNDDNGDECKPEICNDGLDNDCDGNADCWDPDCGFEGLTERSCNDGKDNDCDGDIDGADKIDCGEEDCHNGVDDDGDGSIDCWDPDCPSSGLHEHNCKDDVDNDCDSDTDCADSDCEDDPICDTGVCGNGVIEGSEDCDGTTLGGETCFSLGFEGGGSLLCASCVFDTSNCDDEEPCGNGVIDSGEDCDGTNLGGENCEGLGYDGGDLDCSGSCGFDTSDCYYTELGGIGDPCEDSGDCEGEICGSGWPDGYCTQDCSSESCPGGSTCADDRCYDDCLTNGDCRDGYVCDWMGDPPIYNLCVPFCPSSEWCGEGWICNTSTGLCEREEPCSCTDGDGDGYYSTSCTDSDCTPRTDCDDTEISVHPGATETCNGRDDDCDGTTDEGCVICSCTDGDGDTYYPTSCTDTDCPRRTDCDDTEISVHPGATETCNGRDDDCDDDCDETYSCCRGDTRSCSNACGSGSQTCSSSCSWGSCSAPSSGSVRIDINKDSYISNREPDINFGSETSLLAGVDNDGSIMATYLSFSTSTLPSKTGTTLTSATLYLYKVSSTPDSSTFLLDVGRITES